eukprot:TRINITY_DN7097_c0_g1_i1.p1 TRINITY_DN7097_c0_g1~~TRINITY_DN7097_c0_g1_i1.p1  ORF type:complete len:200 (+),score=35.99 TRINITY_DN7097_c0_g1_i1:103-702(+)
MTKILILHLKILFLPSIPRPSDSRKDELLISDYEEMVRIYVNSSVIGSLPIMQFIGTMYIWMKKMSSRSGSYLMFIEERQSLVKKLFEDRLYQPQYINKEEIVAVAFLEKLIRSVDYIDENDQLQTYSFLRSPASFYLSKNTKIQFLSEEADTTNASTKLKGLTWFFSAFKLEMEYYYELYTRFPLLDFSQRIIAFLKD